MSTATPRLSLVLPLGQSSGSNRKAFDDTLISVLENRGSGCEIIVTHDGSYDDPFDIGDEVRFAVADSNGLVDGVAAGCDAAWGRYVHVLAPGFFATPHWCEPALEAFGQSDVAAVATTMIDAKTRQPIAAGWHDIGGRLMDPIVPDSTDVETVHQGPVRHFSSASSRPIDNGGVFLEASFWRREVLRSLTRACGPTDERVATYAYRFLASQQSWKAVVSSTSYVTTDLASETIEGGGFARSRLLRSIRNHFCGESAAACLLAATTNLLSDPAESLGHLTAAFSAVKVRSWFEPDQVYTADRYQSARRAA